MLLRLQNGLTAMTELTRQQERVAGNLANAATPGYRRDRLFVEVLESWQDAEGAPRSSRRPTQWADLATAPVEATGNPLDVAIEGEGFFVLSDEATGVLRYSRAGRFVLDADGLLRTPDGLLVEGEGGPVALPPAAGLTITAGGDVQAGGQTVARLRLVTFEDPLALRRTAGAAFEAPGQEPIDVERPRLRQGFLEGSNVNPVDELVDMIEAARLYEAQQKHLQTADQLLGEVTRDLGRF